MSPRNTGSVMVLKYRDKKYKNKKINNATWNECPICFRIVRKNKKFCKSCGYRLLR